MRRLYGSLVGMLALTISACTMPYKTPVIEAMRPSLDGFSGLRSLAPGKPLKVLVVHGMCTHDFGWVMKWTGAMSGVFGSPAVSRPSDPVGSIQTARFDFANRGRVVEVTFALWSPATQRAKQALEYDSTGFFPFKRAKFNDSAKSILINDCFADPVIYSGSTTAGTIGSALRRDMAGVVCTFLGGAWRDAACSGGDSTTDRAFITESLGSKMLFDAVETIAPPGKASAAAQRDALRQTRAIYMLANQLPLLRLAEAPAGAALTQATESELRLFGPESPSNDRTTAADGGPLEVVAFTDPNDQFSYRLTYASLAEPPGRIALFNVIVSNATTYFGAIENPWPAHVGYWASPSVPPLVLNGGMATRSSTP